jgi:hypothetical protein
MPGPWQITVWCRKANATVVLDSAATKAEAMKLLKQTYADKNRFGDQYAMLNVVYAG